MCAQNETNHLLEEKAWLSKGLDQWVTTGLLGRQVDDRIPIVSSSSNVSLLLLKTQEKDKCLGIFDNLHDQILNDYNI